MRKTRRLSDEAARVLKLFLRDPSRDIFGLEVLAETGIQSGSLYPILHRLQHQQLLTARWEPLSTATSQGRRPRRLYRLDSANADRASDALAEWQAAARRSTKTTPSLHASGAR